MELYFISCLKGWDKYGITGIRTVGYLESFDEAEQIIINNGYDLYEDGYYPYVIIENIQPGIYQICENPLFYKFNKETKKYEKIDFPEELQMFRGFTIG